MKTHTIAAWLLILSLLILFPVSCSTSPENRLKKADSLSSWPRREKIYMDLAGQQGNPPIVAKALSALAIGYLEEGDAERANFCYLRLAAMTRAHEYKPWKEQITETTAETAGAISKHFIDAVDYLKAAYYLDAQISYMEPVEEIPPDRFLELIDLYLKACSYDKAMEVYNKWFSLYGNSAPMLASQIRDDIVAKATTSPVYR